MEVFASSVSVHREPIPSHAVGHIIGKNGSFLAYLRSFEGVLNPPTENRNQQMLVLTAVSAEALHAPLKDVLARVKSADRSLENQSRQKHSYYPTPGRPDSKIWDARDIHKLPNLPPIPAASSNPKASHRRKLMIDAEKKRERMVREKIGRNQD